MRPDQRIVTAMLLQRLWDDNGELQVVRGRALGRDEVAALLRQGAVRFVLANPGLPLRWVPLSERFEFWKAEGSVHLAEADPIDLSAFPGGTAYAATEWTVRGELVSVVLLEVHH